MGSRQHADSSDEYRFLKNKVIKLISKSSTKGDLVKHRTVKQTKKSLRRMKEIEQTHYRMGFPHPEAKFAPKTDMQELAAAQVGKPILTNPDGSLFQKDAVGQPAGFAIPTRANLTPDGKLFETPVLEGAILNPTIHSEEKIQEYLEKQTEE